MLTAIATGAFCSPNTPAPRRLPKLSMDADQFSINALN
jgi:hypothetical protein